MKKTLFTALRAMCVGAMTLAAVSCYDDSALRGEIDGLGTEVDGLAARLDELESRLNDNVKAVNALTASMTDLEASVKKVLETAGTEDVKAALEKKIAELYGIGVQVANADDSKLADNDITLVAAGK